MNFIFGSASGVGNDLYKIYRNENLDVYGFDKKDSEFTDKVIDLGVINNVDEIVNTIGDHKIDSITYCAGIQDSENISNLFNVNVLSFIEIIKNTNKNFDETIVCGLSSVHSKASNESNIEYASSKSSLESAIRTFSTSANNSYYYFLRLGATDTNLLRENVKDVEKLKKSLPSGELFESREVANLIFTINTEHKKLFNGGHIQIDQGVLSRLATE
ncbi:MAG: hypothetical protein CMA27_05415 [Euryarchaeota archaeon]|nr:hypothetical protein [Euryarchaeota archaeon]|tara:strand:- start:1635 stop:2282 length:648 start_codon:yes stop_codon:yes gene_type:complete